MKVILTPISGETAETSALDCGLDLARRFDGLMRAIHVRENARDALALHPGLLKSLSQKARQEVAKTAESEAEKAAQKAEQLFSRFCDGQGVVITRRPRRIDKPTATWEVKGGDPHHVISIVGRLADLIVIARPGHKLDEDTGRFIKAALFETGSPLLLVPRRRQATLGTRITIAWDCSIAAKRAVFAALPLLAQAEAVRIVSLGSLPRLGPVARDLAEYLNFHGIRSDLVVQRAPRPTPDEALLAAIRDFDSDLVVMGAYTRSRLRQRIFGGFTRTMLNESGLPVLFHN
ncbi:MAG TPA: universal stress protein [Sphingomonadales bacterium]